jgi:hypothetical protein
MKVFQLFQLVFQVQLDGLYPTVTLEFSYPKAFVQKPRSTTPVLTKTFPYSPMKVFQSFQLVFEVQIDALYPMVV